MLFEWDEAKRRRNLRDHRVDFIDMAQIFDGAADRFLFVIAGLDPAIHSRPRA